MAILESLPGFTYGCDPELFILGPDGRYVSAEGLIPGTKENPYKVIGGAVQVDGMAAEFNIDPVTNFNDFETNIQLVIAELKAMLPKGHTLKAKPSVVFEQDIWDATPDNAKVLGCTPDFNAWTGSVNPPPNPKKGSTMRCAGGHLHIGWTEDGNINDMDFVRNCTDLIKQMDWYLGTYSVTQDTDNNRRSLYGKAGAMRFRPYGVEYRTLSNFWIEKKAHRLAVWNRMVQAVIDMRTKFMPEYSERYSSSYDFNGAVVQSINNSKLDDVLLAHFSNPILKL